MFKQPSKSKCSLCAGIALRVVERKFYCALHTDEAFAEARRVGEPRNRMDRGLGQRKWLQIDYAKKEKVNEGIQ
jgi:hypothetical protein